MSVTPTKNAIINDKGYYFDDKAGMSETFNQSYSKKGFRVCLVFKPDKTPMEYLLFEGDTPVYYSTKIEDVAARADMMIFDNKTRSEE